MNSVICLPIIGTTVPMAKPMEPITIRYNKIIEMSLDNLNFLWKNLMTGLNIKNKNPDIINGKNNVDTKVPIGSSKNVSLVHIRMIVNMIRTWIDQFLNLLLVINFTSRLLLYFRDALILWNIYSSL